MKKGLVSSKTDQSFFRYEVLNEATTSTIIRKYQLNVTNQT